MLKTTNAPTYYTPRWKQKWHDARRPTGRFMARILQLWCSPAHFAWDAAPHRAEFGTKESRLLLFFFFFNIVLCCLFVSPCNWVAGSCWNRYTKMKTEKSHKTEKAKKIEKKKDAHASRRASLTDKETENNAAFIDGITTTSSLSWTLFVDLFWWVCVCVCMYVCAQVFVHLFSHVLLQFLGYEYVHLTSCLFPPYYPLFSSFFLPSVWIGEEIIMIIKKRPTSTHIHTHIRTYVSIVTVPPRVQVNQSKRRNRNY